MTKEEEIRVIHLPLTELIEEVKNEVCDTLCKYQGMDPPEGKDDGWLEEEGGPCENCPLNKLL